jgi:L-lactate dehydrogenase (cytochrome)
MLPTIAKAVKGQTEVWFDGGIRSGQDVLRAIGLGAKGTMIGRAFLYGLGAMGEAGVRLCLEIIAKELSVTMGFCGVVDINAVDSSALIAPTLIPEMTDGADIGGAMSSVCVPRRSRPFQ